uniref:(northern house mosquito) hypothetical protein n=1 Tax=Culex pipiens TaxID=7175 RepID=A0A8D8C0K6_CULPI
MSLLMSAWTASIPVTLMPPIGSILSMAAEAVVTAGGGIIGSGSSWSSWCWNCFSPIECSSCWSSSSKHSSRSSKKCSCFLAAFASLAVPAFLRAPAGSCIGPSSSISRSRSRRSAPASGSSRWTS